MTKRITNNEMIEAVPNGYFYILKDKVESLNGRYGNMGDANGPTGFCTCRLRVRVQVANRGTHPHPPRHFGGADAGFLSHPHCLKFRSKLIYICYLYNLLAFNFFSYVK